MSEKAPSISPDAEQAVDFKSIEYKNGHQHTYAKDADGTLHHVSADDMLIARGYTPDDQGGKPIETGDPITMTPEEEKSIYDEYKEAVEAEDVVRIKDPETGKMVETKVKDLNFREWVKQQEMRKAARWYSGTRAHGEAPGEYEDGSWDDGINPDEGASEDEARRMGDRDHQERLNGQEGKDNPTKDDVDYYRWLKSQQNDGEGDGEDDGEDGDDDKEDEPKMPTIEEVLAQDELYKKREAELNAARNDYAELTAKRRKISTLGHKKELAAAKERYENARNLAGAHVAGRMKEMEQLAEQLGIEMEPFNLAQYSMDGAIRELHVLEHEIVDERLEQAAGKKLKPFYDWWARQGGGKFFSKHRMLGNLKKGLVVGALVAPGVLISPFIAAGVATGASVGLVAAGMVGVARGVARGHIDKNASAAELARAQSAAHIKQGEAQIKQDVANGITNFQGEDTTELVEDHTKKEVRRNRTRLGVGVAAGVLAPIAIGKVIDYLPDASKIMGDMPPKPPRVPDNPFDGMSPNELQDFRDMVAHPERFSNLQDRAGVLESIHPDWSPMQIREQLVRELRESNPRY